MGKRKTTSLKFVQTADAEPVKLGEVKIPKVDASDLKIEMFDGRGLKKLTPPEKVSVYHAHVMPGTYHNPFEVTAEEAYAEVTLDAEKLAKLQNDQIESREAGKKKNQTRAQTISNDLYARAYKLLLEDPHMLDDAIRKDLRGQSWFVKNKRNDEKSKYSERTANEKIDAAITQARSTLKTRTTTYRR